MDYIFARLPDISFSRSASSLVIRFRNWERAVRRMKVNSECKEIKLKCSDCRTYYTAYRRIRWRFPVVDSSSSRKVMLWRYIHYLTYLWEQLKMIVLVIWIILVHVYRVYVLVQENSCRNPPYFVRWRVYWRRISCWFIELVARRRIWTNWSSMQRSNKGWTLTIFNYSTWQRSWKILHCCFRIPEIQF